MRFTEKLGGRYIDFSYPSLSFTCIASFVINIPLQSDILITISEPTMTRHHIQSPQFTLQFTLGVIHSMDLNKYVLTCIHYYNIVQNIFTALKILYAPPIHSYPPPPHFVQLPVSGLLTAFIVLLFPECHIVGVIQYVTFSDWLLLLSNMHLSFCYVI